MTQKTLTQTLPELNVDLSAEIPCDFITKSGGKCPRPATKRVAAKRDNCPSSKANVCAPCVMQLAITVNSRISMFILCVDCNATLSDNIHERFNDIFTVRDL